MHPQFIKKGSVLVLDDTAMCYVSVGIVIWISGSHFLKPQVSFETVCEFVGTMEYERH